MKRTPYHDLARQFLDLWEEQSRAMMQDTRFVDALMETLEKTASTSKQPHAPRRSAAPPAAAAPDDGGRSLAKLTRRLDALEARLAKIERRSAPSRAKKRKK